MLVWPNILTHFKKVIWSMKSYNLWEEKIQGIKQFVLWCCILILCQLKHMYCYMNVSWILETWELVIWNIDSLFGFLFYFFLFFSFVTSVWFYRSISTDQLILGRYVINWHFVSHPHFFLFYFFPLWFLKNFLCIKKNWI